MTAAATDYPDNYLIGILLFNRGDWFEAHEAWEAEWKATAGRRREFYQGLIQFAVALCHYFNGNGVGARRLFHSASAYLAPYRPIEMGLDVDKFLAELQICFAPVADATVNSQIRLDVALVTSIVLEPLPATWPPVPDWVFEHD